MPELGFRAWAHSPIGAALSVPDEGQPDLGPGEFAPQATLRGPDAHTTTTITPPNPPRMLGPGGVAGLPASAIGRAFPSPGAVDAAPNDLAALELLVAELPWVLTPARPGTANHLRPWLVLVVVDAATAFDLSARPLPRIRPSTAELPDLAQSWAWGHVQSPPDVARLLCPRRLAGEHRYRACLVPAFAGGVAAGMGVTDPGATSDHRRAWEIEPVHDVELPVYHWWEFATAPEGDFESLVRRLHPADRHTALGSREVDVARPWPDAEPLAGTTSPALLSVRGAMHSPAGGDDHTPPPEAMADFRRRLQAELAVPADRLAADADPGAEVGAVAPPIFGGHHVDVERVEFAEDAPPGEAQSLDPFGWVTQLNLDPAQRFAAGLGADYVRVHQEQLMTRAWAQVGAIREANRRRAMGELARELCVSVHRRHVETLAPGELVGLTAPAIRRIRTAETTLAQEVFASPLPDAAASSSFARLLRPDGHLARRTGTTATSVLLRGLRGEVVPSHPEPLLAAAVGVTAGFLRTPQMTPPVAAERLVKADTVRMVAATNDFAGAAGTLGEQLDALQALDREALRNARPEALVPTVAEDMVAVQETLEAIETTDFSGEVTADGRQVTAIGVQIDGEQLSARLVSALEPGDRHERRLDSCMSLGRASVPPGLRPVMAYPTFPAPMALELLHTQPEWFLPGLAAFPDESVALLAPNNRFIESYLVGLNHELMRELLWREYPTDRRGSPFRRFWPRPGTDVDVPELHTWDVATPLGAHCELSDEAFALLIVRGQVVRRFPDMVVTAVPALPPGIVAGPKMMNPDPGLVRTPLFSFTIDPTTAVYALPVPPDELVVSDPGWFIVFQEHDYKFRFGFDVPSVDENGRPVAGPLGTWDDLTWEHLDPSDGGRGFADALAVLTPGDPRGLVWGAGADSTHVARIALQKPFRVGMQSTLLVTDPEVEP